MLTTKPWTQTLPASGSGHNLSFRQLATLANCTVAGLAAANAAAPIIADGVSFVVRGKPYTTTPQDASLNDVAQRFGAAPYYFTDVNAAEIAASNAEVLAVNPTVTSVQVADYVVRTGDSFALLGESPDIGPAADLIQRNVVTTSIYSVGDSPVDRRDHGATGLDRSRHVPRRASDHCGAVRIVQRAERARTRSSARRPRAGDDAC